MPELIKILLEKLMSLNLFDIQNSNRITIWTNTLNFIYSTNIWFWSRFISNLFNLK